ncbi:hypothetical protein BWGOE3_22310 [Bacillus mycoides]|uniref:Uncharacterized protein n=2 Tax=Bacillaceae TaxID=186817 RepID=A0A1E8BNW4_BACMY|nr:hypothetical protein BWGOE2_22350 [Bacillus mycoides]OFD47811.1 hypothetical protein BWGOE1_22910 [Bacillus mycoides]OFD49873.1 hypothetical protein BWGOE3_22310 [Bacillus mycoides]OFD61305.1 hypothetical protein BWGOE6_23120 [Bacillus mycoides]OFD95280.1 hypothetical protein BWGOE11_23890 [Bacillus mycoides]
MIEMGSVKLQKWIEKYLDKSNRKHNYSFIKIQDNEDYKNGKLGVAFIRRCEKCGEEKIKFKNNNDINIDFFD